MKNLKILSNKVINSNTTEKEFLEILIKNRGLDKHFLKLIRVRDIGPSNFGIKREDFEKAVGLIQESIRKQTKVVIYGDYDIDGITSTALLWKAIFPQNKNIKPIIPDREKDGYGLNPKTVESYCQKNDFWPELLILVDNGIVAQKEIKQLKKKIDKIIIIDHHLKNKDKIEADAIVHSSDTSASVLSFLVARAIDVKTDCELAALGLIGDMADLSNIFNRNIVIEGLKLINQGVNLGIKTILEVSGVGNKKVDEWTVGFVIGPRINASGRMGDATRALRLLSFSDKEIVRRLALELEEENKKRQMEERKIMDQFLKKNYDKQKIIVEMDEIQPGIIGLLAGKLCQNFGKPSIVVTKINPKIYKGSARSIEDFDITKFLRKNDSLFESLGGHKGAAGFSIKAKNYTKWLAKFKETPLDIKIIKSAGVCEARMKINAVNIKNFEVIEKLRPWGEANPPPLFLFENLRVVDKRLIGKDQNHLKLTIDDPETTFTERMVVEAIGWGMGERENVNVDDMITVVCQMTLNEYGNKRQVELMVKEIWL